MEGGEGFFPFGGDPEEIMRGLREFAEQQAEGRLGGAARAVRDACTLSTAVGLTQAALAQDVQPTGGVDEQSLAASRRDARAVSRGGMALVSAARGGFMREMNCQRVVASGRVPVCVRWSGPG